MTTVYSVTDMVKKTGLSRRTVQYHLQEHGDIPLAKNGNSFMYSQKTFDNLCTLHVPRRGIGNAKGVEMVKRIEILEKGFQILRQDIQILKGKADD